MELKTRKTKQKDIIEQEIKNYDGIFNAERILKKIKEKDKKISSATVYRFLKNLRKNNRIGYYICNRKTIYSNKKSHCHFICSNCKKIIHFNVKSAEFLNKIKVGKPTHFLIEVYGICDDCIKGNK